MTAIPRSAPEVDFGNLVPGFLELPADPDEAVLQTLIEAKRAAGRLKRCAERARASLQWRCSAAAEEIQATLARYFPARTEDHD